MHLIHFCNHFISLLFVYYTEQHSICNFDILRRLILFLDILLLLN